MGNLHFEQNIADWWTDFRNVWGLP